MMDDKATRRREAVVEPEAMVSLQPVGQESSDDRQLNASVAVVAESDAMARRRSDPDAADLAVAAANEVVATEAAVDPEETTDAVL